MENQEDKRKEAAAATTAPVVHNSEFSIKHVSTDETYRIQVGDLVKEARGPAIIVVADLRTDEETLRRILVTNGVYDPTSQKNFLNKINLYSDGSETDQKNL
ncbi:hypothetical protein SD70_27755 [Gordoniibacillus kamchatkensis]|uniref:Uncharacterized protein n=1 Tax=Gordoniibacillus kamchatkensis TaxID=1590651 RepID=A0ABR5AB80_9BACL|nr:hypothetical protein [Paenibacillus sp. VKM B-2647]KIL38225.1 hypothetical protein SD70_27755 [Paenibacillus sp. VKM B-2647]